MFLLCKIWERIILDMSKIKISLWYYWNLRVAIFLLIQLSNYNPVFIKCKKPILSSCHMDIACEYRYLLS